LVVLKEIEKSLVTTSEKGIINKDLFIRLCVEMISRDAKRRALKERIRREMNDDDEDEDDDAQSIEEEDEEEDEDEDEEKEVLRGIARVM
jgi:TATA-binding protein-associated factor Taf7